MNEKEEMRLLFCAPSKTAALKHSKKFPQSKYIGPHPSNKQHHFFFSSPIDSNCLQGFKDNFNEFAKEDINIIMFHVVSEKRNYHPDQQHHCQSCRAHHKKK